MNIIHFISADGFSGLEKVACRIIKALPEKYTGYYAAPTGSGIISAQKLGVKTIECDTSSVSEIKRICREYSPCIAHAHDPRMSLNCALAGVRFVSHLHSNCPWLSKICPNSLGLLFAVSRTSKVFCVSQSITDEFIFKRKLQKKAEVLPNYIDVGEIKRLTGNIPEIKYDMCCVGRFTKLKRPELFVRLVCDVKEALNKVRAVMVGDGENKEETKKLAERLGVADCIDFVGFCENPYTFIAESKIGVLTSASEGFGLAAAECLALGLPFLCYPIGGLPDIVDDKCGHLCQSPEEMAAEAVKMLSDSDYYERLSYEAAQKSKKFSDADTYVSQIVSAYEKEIAFDNDSCR